MFESSKYDLIPEGNFSKISNKIGIGEYKKSERSFIGKKRKK